MDIGLKSTFNLHLFTLFASPMCERLKTSNTGYLLFLKIFGKLILFNFEYFQVFSIEFGNSIFRPRLAAASPLHVPDSDNVPDPSGGQVQMFGEQQKQHNPQGIIAPASFRGVMLIFAEIQAVCRHAPGYRVPLTHLLLH